MPERSQYNFWGALRVFSLAVTLISCGLGIRLGWNPAAPQFGLALLLLLGGLLAQAGMNLINDTEDLTLAKAGSMSGITVKNIVRNQKIGWIAFLLAGLIGVYLINLRGWPLFGIFTASALLALSYNAGPLNFKHHGIAIVQVFLLMGPIMVGASYYTLSGQFSSQVIWLSLPASLLISLLLLSNEIRDYESDKMEQTQTLSVRIGLPAAKRLYWILILTALMLSVAYAISGWILTPRLLAFLPALLMLPKLKNHLYATDRQSLTPLSGRYFLLFGLAYLYACPGLDQT